LAGGPWELEAMSGCAPGDKLGGGAWDWAPPYIGVRIRTYRQIVDEIPPRKPKIPVDFQAEDSSTFLLTWASFGVKWSGVALRW